ncbi:Hypothetical_protein [Hexamita inflata]|uniref:Hypothetical_protein n=1 Tax=Hexamita inflata TaxID=28002 RepID=A0AA86R0Q8_9EUKA|nr:Hypothetical protein HINF_LOCUS8216 [Hexamita inflata]CAI9966937.1 Hypothetical protein HINF_LOCUS54582 [Hexamita inflata]
MSKRFLMDTLLYVRTDNPKARASLLQYTLQVASKLGPYQQELCEQVIPMMFHFDDQALSISCYTVLKNLNISFAEYRCLSTKSFLQKNQIIRDDNNFELHPMDPSFIFTFLMTYNEYLQILIKKQNALRFKLSYENDQNEAHNRKQLQELLENNRIPAQNCEAINDFYCNCVEFKCENQKDKDKVHKLFKMGFLGKQNKLCINILNWAVENKHAEIINHLIRILMEESAENEKAIMAAYIVQQSGKCQVVLESLRNTQINIQNQLKNAHLPIRFFNGQQYTYAVQKVSEFNQHQLQTLAQDIRTIEITDFDSYILQQERMIDKESFHDILLQLRDNLIPFDIIWNTQIFCDLVSQQDFELIKDKKMDLLVGNCSQYMFYYNLQAQFMYENAQNQFELCGISQNILKNLQKYYTFLSDVFTEDLKQKYQTMLKQLI